MTIYFSGCLLSWAKPTLHRCDEERTYPYHKPKSVGAAARRRVPVKTSVIYFFQAVFQYTTKMERRRLVAIFQIFHQFHFDKIQSLATSRRRSMLCYLNFVVYRKAALKLHLITKSLK